MTFVGVGGAFTTAEYYHSNVLVESNGKKMLLDCGSDARFSLAPYGITNYTVGTEIDAVYISHIHMDHMGGLEWLGFCSYFNPKAKKPKLYIHGSLEKPLWESLKGGMGAHTDGELTLDDFFDTQVFFREPVSPNVKPDFKWQEAVFSMIRTEHIPCSTGWVPSYGLFITAKKKVFFSADSRLFPALMDQYRKADLIFQDCETLEHRSGVHAHYDELKELPAEIKAKMWLYHYYPNPTQIPTQDGFCGFVKKGQKFEI
jgi:ribonuclease BN (tRNA processing enzyme)